MKMITDNLIADFHNLQGDTLQEKHKSFQYFLSKIKAKHNDVDQDKLIAELQPLNNLEHLFRIDLLSHLKRNNELLEILKGGNREHIGRILKNFEFFAETIPKIDPKTLIDDLFPQTSFVIKKKVINRICKTVKNEQLLDEYFQAIKGRYGLRMALALLPGCSIKLIKLNVENYKPKLTGRHVIEIYKKDPTFPLLYFRILKQKDNAVNLSYEYPRVIKYLLKVDTKVFWQLHEEFHFNFKAGKHLTKKLILQNEDILNKGQECTEWFQVKVLYKTVTLQNKIENFLLSFYQETPMEFLKMSMESSCNIHKILILLPPNKRYTLIQNLFYKKYSKNIVDYEMLFPKYFLELMPIDAREAIVEKHLDKSDEYTYLLGTDKSIPLFKKMLQNCSKKEQRAQVMEEICKTLQINKDKTAVQDFIKFMFERYRNDARTLTVFTARLSTWKDLEDFGEEHLKMLYELALYTKTLYSNQYSFEKISNAYFCHLIKHELSFDDHLLGYIKTNVTGDYYYVVLFPADFKYQKLILERAIDIIDSFKDNDKVYNETISGLINCVYEYNKRHKRNAIPLSKYKVLLIQALEYDFSYSTVRYELFSCIKKYQDEDLHKYFWNDYHKDWEDHWTMVHWYLKYDIKYVEEYLNDILSRHLGNPAVHVLRAIRKFATANIRTQIIAGVEAKLSFDDTKASMFLVKLLSYADSKGFLKVTAPFMPPVDGVLDGENIANKNQVQGAIIRSLANIKVDNLLDIVKKVCVGDYLKYGLQPLYKYFYNTKEIEIFPLLKDLKQSPVSLGKHSLLLSRHLLPTKQAMECIDKALENERNISLKNIVFMKTLELFIETQTIDTWKHSKEYFTIVNADDTAMQDFMINYIKKVPSAYITEYLQTTYDVLKTAKSKEFVKKVASLAKSIPQSEINTVSISLLEDIIALIVREMFLHDYEEDCFWDFVINSNTTRSKQLLCCAIDNMKIAISDTSAGYAKYRIALNSFACSFVEKVLNKKTEEHKKIVDMFALQWNMFPRHCLVDTVVLLKITVAYYDSKFDLEKFALLLNNLLHENAKEYDSNIVLWFCRQLIVLCKFCKFKDDSLYTLAHTILKSDDHKFNYIFAIMLLPKSMFPSEDNKFYKWVDIIKSIEEYSQKEGSDSASVMLYYDDYLREHRKEYIWIGNQ